MSTSFVVVPIHSGFRQNGSVGSARQAAWPPPRMGHVRDTISVRESVGPSGSQGAICCELALCFGKMVLSVMYHTLHLFVGVSAVSLLGIACVVWFMRIRDCCWYYSVTLTFHRRTKSTFVTTYFCWWKAHISCLRIKKKNKNSLPTHPCVICLQSRDLWHEFFIIAAARFCLRWLRSGQHGNCEVPLDTNPVPFKKKTETKMSRVGKKSSRNILLLQKRILRVYFVCNRKKKRRGLRVVVRMFSTAAYVPHSSVLSKYLTRCERSVHTSPEILWISS